MSTWQRRRVLAEQQRARAKLINSFSISEWHDGSAAARLRLAGIEPRGEVERQTFAVAGERKIAEAEKIERARTKVVETACVHCQQPGARYYVGQLTERLWVCEACLRAVGAPDLRLLYSQRGPGASGERGSSSLTERDAARALYDTARSRWRDRFNPPEQEPPLLPALPPVGRKVE